MPLKQKEKISQALKKVPFTEDNILKTLKGGY